MKKYLVFVIAVFILLFLIRKFVIVTDVDRIKKIIYKGRTAIENESTADILNLLAPDFQDTHGNNLKLIEDEINSFYNLVDSIKIPLSIKSIRITTQDNTKCALCSLKLRVFAYLEGEKGLIYGGIKPADVLLGLYKKGKDWKVNRAEY